MCIIKKIKHYIQLSASFESRLQKIQQSLGRLESRQLEILNPKSFNDYEYPVYSQWGEDGLIQYLVHRVAIGRQIFVEFGVEKYTESNTRFLLANNNWSGLVIDGSEQNIQFIKRDPIYWRHNLKAEYAFIDKDNINALIEKNGISGDIGLLSIDIDGNDYWVWQSVDIVSPRIVVCEYNSLWGCELAVSTPYDPGFRRTVAHYSNLYYGASIAALTQLAASKGYTLVGGNRAGNNLFFVRNDVLGDLPAATPQQAWVPAAFSESRDAAGQLTFLPFADRLALLAELPLVNLENGKTRSIRELYQLQKETA